MRSCILIRLNNLNEIVQSSNDIIGKLITESLNFVELWPVCDCLRCVARTNVVRKFRKNPTKVDTAPAITKIYPLSYPLQNQRYQSDKMQEKLGLTVMFLFCRPTLPEQNTFSEVDIGGKNDRSFTEDIMAVFQLLHVRCIVLCFFSCFFRAHDWTSAGHARSLSSKVQQGREQL